MTFVEHEKLDWRRRRKGRFNMLGSLGQLAGLLKNAGKIRENMQGMQSRLASARFVGEAAGGQAAATVDGRGELISLKLEPGLLNGDKELLEDLVVAAVNDAVRRSREALQKEMEQMTGGLGLGDLSGLLNTGG